MDSRRWDERYSDEGYGLMTDPNPFLVSELAGRAPGRALDLAAGAGRHSVWLAGHGWRVTGVDFSRVGLDRARALSAAHGVSVDWVLCDLLDYKPATSAFDLVLIAYMHLDPPSRRIVLGRAATALAPGGTLIIVGHDLANLADGTGCPKHPEVAYTAEALSAELSGLLSVVRAGQVKRAVGDEVAIDTVVVATLPPLGG